MPTMEKELLLADGDDATNTNNNDSNLKSRKNKKKKGNKIPESVSDPDEVATIEKVTEELKRYDEREAKLDKGNLKVFRKTVDEKCEKESDVMGTQELLLLYYQFNTFKYQKVAFEYLCLKMPGWQLLLQLCMAAIDDEKDRKELVVLHKENLDKHPQHQQEAVLAANTILACGETISDNLEGVEGVSSNSTIAKQKTLQASMKELEQERRYKVKKPKITSRILFFLAMYLVIQLANLAQTYVEQPRNFIPKENQRMVTIPILGIATNHYVFEEKYRGRVILFYSVPIVVIMLGGYLLLKFLRLTMFTAFFGNWGRLFHAEARDSGMRAVWDSDDSDSDSEVSESADDSDDELLKDFGKTMGDVKKSVQEITSRQINRDWE